MIPAYIIAYISTPDPLNYLKLRAKHNLPNYFMVGIIAISSIAVINVLAKWNSGLNLPDSMDALENVIQKMEESAGNMQERMLNVNTIFGLLINIFVIAIIPAVSEEFLFRGVIQRLLRDWTKNIHVAIIITGIIFSVVHFQFYGFVPRMFLGILFGYLLYWTNNLWVPIAAHFLNNAIAVISYYIYYNSDNKIESLNPDEIGLQSNSILLYLSIAALFLACFYFIKRKREATL
jgi:membrane protease YdiL (CAAX protease family)